MDGNWLGVTAHIWAGTQQDHTPHAYKLERRLGLFGLCSGELRLRTGPCEALAGQFF